MFENNCFIYFIKFSRWVSLFAGLFLFYARRESPVLVITLWLEIKVTWFLSPSPFCWYLWSVSTYSTFHVNLCHCLPNCARKRYYAVYVHRYVKERGWGLLWWEELSNVWFQEIEEMSRYFRTCFQTTGYQRARQNLSVPSTSRVFCYVFCHRFRDFLYSDCSHLSGSRSVI